MTNQEAIKRIKEHIAIHKYRESHAIHIVEALEMAISALQAQDVPDTNVGKMDGDELDEAIRHCDEIVQDITWFCNSPSKYIEQRRHESAVKLRQLASWLQELKRLRTEVYFLKAEKENKPVDLLSDVPCKTCRWEAVETERCDECIDGVDNYEAKEPCEDAVSREAAIDVAENAFVRGLLASPDIRKLPSVTPERKKGKWQITDAYPHNVYCSECHTRFAQTHWAVWEDGSLPRNFCPNCGADMREETDAV